MKSPAIDEAGTVHTLSLAMRGCRSRRSHPHGAVFVKVKNRGFFVLPDANNGLSGRFAR